MDGARSSARSVRSTLLSQGVKDVPVEAVLMIWGPGAGQLENDWAVVDEVHVVRGVAAADAWRQHCISGDISAARAKELHGSSGAIGPGLTPTPKPRLVMLIGALAPRVRDGLASVRADAKAAVRRKVQIAFAFSGRACRVNSDKR
jgi:hypothetical protein